MVAVQKRLSGPFFSEPLFYLVNSLLRDSRVFLEVIDFNFAKSTIRISLLTMYDNVLGCISAQHYLGTSIDQIYLNKSFSICLNQH